jgi:hypothetical protein
VIAIRPSLYPLALDFVQCFLWPPAASASQTFDFAQCILLPQTTSAPQALDFAQGFLRSQTAWSGVSYPEFHDTLLPVAKESGVIGVRRVGNWLSKINRFEITGRRIVAVHGVLRLGGEGGSLSPLYVKKTQKGNDVFYRSGWKVLHLLHLLHPAPQTGSGARDYRDSFAQVAFREHHKTSAESAADEVSVHQLTALRYKAKRRFYCDDYLYMLINHIIDHLVSLWWRRSSCAHQRRCELSSKLAIGRSPPRRIIIDNNTIATIATRRPWWRWSRIHDRPSSRSIHSPAIHRGQAPPDHRGPASPRVLLKWRRVRRCRQATRQQDRHRQGCRRTSLGCGCRHVRHG